MNALAFELPHALEAHEPPEARGLERDEVRLLVATLGDGEIAHHRFRDLPELLLPGDAVVVNVSGTLAAAVGAERRDGSAVELRFATAASEVTLRIRAPAIRRRRASWTSASGPVTLIS